MEPSCSLSRLSLRCGTAEPGCSLPKLSLRCGAAEWAGPSAVAQSRLHPAPHDGAQRNQLGDALEAEERGAVPHISAKEAVRESRERLRDSRCGLMGHMHRPENTVHEVLLQHLDYQRNRLLPARVLQVFRDLLVDLPHLLDPLPLPVYPICCRPLSEQQSGLQTRRCLRLRGVAYSWGRPRKGPHVMYRAQIVACSRGQKLGAAPGAATRASVLRRGTAECARAAVSK